MKGYGRRWRFASAFAVAVVSATVLVAVATPKPKEPAAQQYEEKETICHHTGSQRNPTVTIVVSGNAVLAHLAHGDTLGPCPD
jgi:ABC-type sugar transport system substrate-binding protein